MMPRYKLCGCMMNSEWPIGSGANGDKTDVATRLKSVRLVRGYSVDEFAEALGISRSSLYLYGKGERELSVSHLGVLFEKFGVNPTWLITGEAEKYLSTS